MEKKAKLEMETLGKILLLTAFMIMLLIMFKGYKDLFSDVGMVGMKEYSCWGSNLINAEASSLFPTTCSPTIIEEYLEKKDISDLIRRCWWMYGQGELDIKSEGVIKGTVTKSIDQIYTCYAFKPKEDTSLISLREHMQNYTIGNKKAEKAEDAAWYYIQQGTKEENAICFEKKGFTASNGILSARKTYYINFYDEREIGSEGDKDKIMISRNSKFGEELTGIQGWVKSFFIKYCYGIDKEAEKNYYLKLIEEQKKICERYNETECHSNLDNCIPYFKGTLGRFDSCQSCIKGFDDSTNKVIPLVKTCHDIKFIRLCNSLKQGGEICGVDLKCKWDYQKPKNKKCIEI